MNQLDLEQMLGQEEQVAENFKEFLRKNLESLSKQTGLSKKALDDYIERLMVM
jgi:hypothetical protein